MPALYCATTRRSVTTSTICGELVSNSVFQRRRYSRHLLWLGQVMRTSCRQLRSRPRYPAILLCRQRHLPRGQQYRRPPVLLRPSPSSRFQRELDIPPLGIQTLRGEDCCIWALRLRASGAAVAVESRTQSCVPALALSYKNTEPCPASSRPSWAILVIPEPGNKEFSFLVQIHGYLITFSEHKKKKR